VKRVRVTANTRINAVWILTSVLTIVGTVIALGRSTHHVPSTVEAIAVLAIAAIKAGCILWEFMEVRAAPLWLRRFSEAWLAGLWLTIVIIYVS
jgi:heme/copper-type cytochrome/quinol oxidase subunit 4